MNIFEQLDSLIKSTEKTNESVSYEDLPIEPSMSTAEQAEECIRDYFQKMLDTLDAKRTGKKDDKKDDDKKPPMGPLPPTPPPPPISIEGGDDSKGGDEEKKWSDKDLEWEDDDFMKRLEIEAEELKKDEDDEDGEEYDDFTDKTPKGSSGGVGDDDDENDDFSEDEDGSGSSKSDKKKDGGDTEDETGGEKSETEETEGGEKSTEGGERTGESKEGEETEGGERTGESKEGEETEGGEKSTEGGERTGESKEGEETEGEHSSSDEELKETIEDALERLSEKFSSEKEELDDMLRKLKDESTTEEDIDEMEKEMEESKEHGKEKLDKLKSLVGRLEKSMSKEDLEKEIEASKLSDEEIAKLKEETIENPDGIEPPTDEELKRLREEAREELNKKCKGHSRLATSILYHSLRTPKIDKTDWDIIMDKVLKNKSKHISDLTSKSKTKKIILGDKNHLWRDVRFGYKTVRGGEDKHSVYCFIDYSGSVRYEPGLIITFLGKVLELTEKLTYTDLHLYTFADSLSVMRIINDKMVKEDGYEKVLKETIDFFELPENYVGGSIENFEEVGYEINRIKRDDKHAIFFIFGDGDWTFYGNHKPPTKLKEICPRYIKDIIPFIFYKGKELPERIGKEISLLKDVVGIDDVIVTKADDMKR